MGQSHGLRSAHRFVEAAATSGYQAEKEALQEALGTTATSCEIKQVRNPDLEAARFLTDWWVLLVPTEGDTLAEDDAPVLASFADRLATDVANQLAFRTFVVFSAAGRLLPLNAVKLGASQFWPADEDDLRMIASGLGAEVMESIHLQAWDSFFAELVGASRAATLLRLRQKAGLVADEEIFNSKFSSACRAAERCHPSLQA